MFTHRLLLPHTLHRPPRLTQTSPHPLHIPHIRLHRTLRNLIQHKPPQTPIPPLLNHPQRRRLQIRHSPFLQPPGLDGQRGEELRDVVCRGNVFGVDGGVVEVQVEEEVVCEGGGGDDGVLDAAAEGELEHGFGVLHVGHEHPRGIDEVDAFPVFGAFNDLHRGADLSGDAGLCAREGDFGLVHPDVSQGVEERGFADVRHADDHHAGAGQGVFGGGVGLGEVEDAAHG